MALKRVLITGAAGQIGTALWKAWEAEGRYELTLADVREIEGARSRVEIGDVRENTFASKVCQDQDVLLSLAYVRADNVGNAEGQLTDIGLQMQLFEIARSVGVGKIVYASSNKTTGLNEQVSNPPAFSTVDQFNPSGWYGAMKGMAEIAGRIFAHVYDRRFIGIRIGTFDKGRMEPKHLRECSTLLAPVDAVQLLRLAVDYEGLERFLITYGASENVYGGHTGFLDLSVAKEVLGYEPEVNMMSFRSRFVASHPQ